MRILVRLSLLLLVGSRVAMAQTQPDPEPIFIQPPNPLIQEIPNPARALTYQKMAVGAGSARDKANKAKQIVTNNNDAYQNQVKQEIIQADQAVQLGLSPSKPDHYMETLNPLSLISVYSEDLNVIKHPIRFLNCLQFSIKGICYRLKFKRFLGVPVGIDYFNIALIKEWRWPVAKGEVVEHRGVSRYYTPWLDRFNTINPPLGNPLTLDLRRIVEKGDEILRSETLGIGDATRAGLLLNANTQLVRNGRKAYGPGLAKWNMRYAQSAAVSQGAHGLSYKYDFLNNDYDPNTFVNKKSTTVSTFGVSVGSEGAGEAKSVVDSGMHFTDDQGNITSQPLNYLRQVTVAGPNNTVLKPYDNIDQRYFNYAKQEYGSSRFEYRVHPVPEASILKAFYNTFIATVINATIVAPMAPVLEGMCSIFLVIVLPPFNVEVAARCVQQMTTSIATAANIDFDPRAAPPYFSEGPQGILMSRSLALNGVIYPTEMNAQLQAPLGCSNAYATPGLGMNSGRELTNADMFGALVHLDAVQAVIGRTGCIKGRQQRIAPVLAQTPQMYSSTMAELGLSRGFRAAFTFGKIFPLLSLAPGPFPARDHIPYFNIDTQKDTFQWVRNDHMPPDCLDQIDDPKFSNLGNMWETYEDWDARKHNHNAEGQKIHRKEFRKDIMHAAYHWHFFRYCPWPGRLFCGSNCSDYGCPRYGSGDCR